MCGERKRDRCLFGDTSVPNLMPCLPHLRPLPRTLPRFRPATDGVQVVLQMPRGNLETVAPRSLVLPAVAAALDADNYAGAEQKAGGAAAAVQPGYKPNCFAVAPAELALPSVQPLLAACLSAACCIAKPFLLPLLSSLQMPGIWPL